MTERAWSLYTSCGPIVLGILANAGKMASRESCCIQSRHLAIALLEDASILTKALGLLPAHVHSILTELSFAPLEAYRPPSPEVVDVYRLSNECKRIFAYGRVEASKRSPKGLTSAQDILIGLLIDQDVPTSRVLRKHGLQIDDVRRALDSQLL